MPMTEQLLQSKEPRATMWPIRTPIASAWRSHLLSRGRKRRFEDPYYTATRGRGRSASRIARSMPAPALSVRESARFSDSSTRAASRSKSGGIAVRVALPHSTHLTNANPSCEGVDCRHSWPTIQQGNLITGSPLSLRLASSCPHGASESTLIGQLPVRSTSEHHKGGESTAAE